MMPVAQIKSLSKRHQAIFLALTCEKMLHSIIKFDGIEGSNGLALANEAITIIYAFALGNEISIVECRELKLEIENFAPDTAESDNEFAPYALHSCIALSEALAFIIAFSFVHIVNCITAATDTVDMYIQMVSDNEPPLMPELDAFIASNLYMIRELSRQGIIAKALTEIPVVNASAIDSLRKLNGHLDIIDLDLL